MNETITITLIGLIAVTFMVVAIVWRAKKYKDDDYIRKNNYVIDDFYTFSKEIKDV